MSRPYDIMQMGEEVIAVNLRQINSTKNVPVIDLETGTVLGRVMGWVANPKNQRIAAFLLDKAFPFQKWPVIVPADIAEYGPRMIVAKDRQVIITSQEVVGLPELIANKIALVGFKAETQKGKILGTVTDFVFDTITSQIQKYYIRPQTVAGTFRDELILPANKVISISTKKLIFADDADIARVTISSKQTQRAPGRIPRPWAG